MTLLSFDHFLGSDAEDILLWLESTEGMVSKVPIIYDWDDYYFLAGRNPKIANFPPQLWARALQWRYNQGLIRAIKDRKVNGTASSSYNIGLECRDGNKLGTTGLLSMREHGMEELLNKLGGRPDYARIRKLHAQDKLQDMEHEQPKYGYDVSQTYEQEGDNPRHHAAGMPVMQSHTASRSLSAWAHGTFYGILGEVPHPFQGQAVQNRKIRGWQYVGIPYMPSIIKEVHCLFIPKGGSEDDVHIQKRAEAIPILLPGKYVPKPKDPFSNIPRKKSGGGFDAHYLMRRADKFSEEEMAHFKNKKYGPEHHIARHQDVRHKAFYVIGGWSPTNLDKGEHPMFTNEDELFEFLHDKPGGKLTWDKILTKEAEDGVEGYLSSASVQFTPEGIVMQMMFHDLAMAAKENIIRNLGDPHVGPFKYDNNGKEILDPKINSDKRRQKASNYVHSVKQTNVSLIGGTRRQRERWAREGKGPTAEVAPLITGPGSRRWIELTRGYKASRWIGSSMRYMRLEMESLDKEAYEKEQEAEHARKAEDMIHARHQAIGAILEKLLKKHAMLQVTWHSDMGIAPEDIQVKRDQALASALSELPHELRHKGIKFDKLPDDVAKHFKPMKDWVGRTPATEQENRGIGLINKLISDKEVEMAGHKFTIKDLAQDDELYDTMISYVDNLKQISPSAKERMQIKGAIMRLKKEVDNSRMEMGMEIRGQQQDIGFFSVSPEMQMQQQKQLANSKAMTDKILSKDTITKLISDPKAREAFMRDAQRAYKAGQITDEAFQKVSKTIQGLQSHLGIDEMVGTGVVAGAHPKFPKHRTFNIWGTPGSTGQSIEGWPIGTKEDKGNKKKKKKRKKK